MQLLSDSAEVNQGANRQEEITLFLQEQEEPGVCLSKAKTAIDGVPLTGMVQIKHQI